MENGFEAFEFNGKTLDLWRRFLGIVADFPKETSPQPWQFNLSADGLIRTTEDSTSAVSQATGDDPQASANVDLGIPKLPADVVPPRAPEQQSTPIVPVDLGLPGVPHPEQSVATPATPASDVQVVSEPRVPAINAALRLGLPNMIPPRREHDLVGQPSSEDPFGQDDRDGGVLSHQRRYDHMREEMIETYFGNGEDERDFRGEQTRMMRRMAVDLGADYRQLLDISSAYERSRDTLTDSPI